MHNKKLIGLFFITVAVAFSGCQKKPTVKPPEIIKPSKEVVKTETAKEQPAPETAQPVLENQEKAPLPITQEAPAAETSSIEPKENAAVTEQKSQVIEEENKAVINGEGTKEASEEEEINKPISKNKVMEPRPAGKLPVFVSITNTTGPSRLGASSVTSASKSQPNIPMATQPAPSQTASSQSINAQSQNTAATTSTASNSSSSSDSAVITPPGNAKVPGGKIIQPGQLPPFTPVTNTTGPVAEDER
jgi:hypothetical protein